MPFIPRPTEEIARGCLFGSDGNGGLALQLFQLCQQENDNNIQPWQHAELVLKEMLSVVRTVQTTIQARELRPHIGEAVGQ